MYKVADAAVCVIIIDIFVFVSLPLGLRGLGRVDVSRVRHGITGHVPATAVSPER